jgi:uncharacterized protein (TIGR03089 family)
VPPPNDTPAALLHRLATSDPTRPRLTWYDDEPGATRGERIELSGRVLANWVAKAANLLQDDLDVGPGSVVAVELPVHWRTAYWLFAVWSVGAEAVMGQRAEAADVVVTDRPEARSGRSAQQVVPVSLPALSRDPAQLALASYSDVFGPNDVADPEDPALDTGVDAGTARYSYGQVVPQARGAAASAGLADGARVLTSAPPQRFVEAWLPSWTVDGSLVLLRPEEGATDRLDQIVREERVTDRL